MGLVGSKNKREITISNPEQPGQVYVTEDAITNIINSAKSNASQTNKPEAQKTQKQNETKGPTSDLDTKLNSELHDKRILEYEKSLIDGFTKSSAEVENLFRDRYTTYPVCYDLQKNIVKCYSDNPKQTLNCLDISNEFVKCVERERQKKYGLPAVN